jgi:phosphoenolpyruvate---glycerone phosphotransferase subunit DhaL
MADVKVLLKVWATLMAANRQRLIELDSAVGDSDLGLTMTDGFRAAYEAVKESPETDQGLLAYFAGKAMGSAVPSTMGTLMASGLMNAGKELKGVESLDGSGWIRFFQAYYHGVQSRGKAQPGDKTFLDGLLPAIAVLQQYANDIQAGAPMAAAAANDAFLATRGMLARHGRMAIHGEQSRQYLDPGAAVAALLMEGFATVIAEE